MRFLIVGRHEHNSFLIQEIEHEQHSEKEAWANAQKKQKNLEKIAETKRRIGETNKKENTKKRTRQNGSETINYLREKVKKDLELKKEENSIKQMKEEDLRVFSQNQFQLVPQVTNDQREQMQKVPDILQTRQQQQNQLVFAQLQPHRQLQQILMEIK